MPANDGTADVWYGLIELDAGRIVLSTHRLAYDHVAAAAAVRRAGHADGYARTLMTGLWPSLDIFPAARARRDGQALAPPHPAPRAAPGARVGRSPLPACGERVRVRGGRRRRQSLGYSTSSPFSALAISARVFSTP